MNKKFGRLEDGKLVLTKLPIRVGNTDYITTNPTKLLELGQKEIVYTAQPQSDEGTYTAGWKETDTQIVQEWSLVPYTEAELEKSYGIEIVKSIRKNYDMSTELAILRKYLAYGDLYKAEFDAYNECVERCKEQAHKKIYKKEYTRPAINNKRDTE